MNQALDVRLANLQRSGSTAFPEESGQRARGRPQGQLGQLRQPDLVKRRVDQPTPTTIDADQKINCDGLLTDRTATAIDDANTVDADGVNRDHCDRST